MATLDFSRLTTEERLDLIGEIWDSIDHDAVPLSDAQVAAQLVISPRTVNWHLTSIYGKLQVSSRAAATRYAVEHYLV